jgi:hypothetical protein
MWQILKPGPVKPWLFTAATVFAANGTHGQISGSELTGAAANSLQASALFLTIAPDGRSTGMGDVGAASVPDVYSQHWNAAKYVFTEKKAGISITYTPWLRNLIPGMNLGYLSGYYKINDKNIVSSSIRYLSLGEIYQAQILPAYAYHPYEVAADAGYSRKFTDHFSGGIVFRYIHSDPTGGETAAGGQETQPGTSIAGDINLYYQNEIQMGERDTRWALGFNISNIGTPIAYHEDAEKTPIPTNLRLGGRFEYRMNDNHSISLNADVNKLLIPTAAIYEEDTATGNLILIRGKEVPRTVMSGMFRSFYDAPGVLQADGTYSVATEEFHEISFSLGTEYRYRKLFALRTGYFHEHATKGNRQYVTFGLGARYRFLAFDMSYLLPVQGQDSPLSNTFRFSLTADLPL